MVASGVSMALACRPHRQHCDGRRLLAHRPQSDLQDQGGLLAIDPIPLPIPQTSVWGLDSLHSIRVSRPFGPLFL